MSSEREQFLVLPITGMGGIGKTTLAQMVYNDPKVSEAFNPKVSLPEKFVLQTVIGNIIQLETRENCSDWTLQVLQSRLREILKDRTFLLVLDDCWPIFLKTAFNKEKPKHWQEELGKSVIQKCRGVPLAVQTMGNLLRDARDDTKWRKIEKNELWDNAHQHVILPLPALKLSYDHTPYHLRSCFAYCALFGKGYPFYRKDLINIWMAQGLLQLRNGIEEMEDVGEEYFDGLLSRSFFQIPGDAVIEKYVMQAAGVFNWNSDWASLKQGFEKKMIGDVGSIRQMFTDYRGKLPFVEMHDLFQDLAASVAGDEIVSGLSSSRITKIIW